MAEMKPRGGSKLAQAIGCPLTPALSPKEKSVWCCPAGAGRGRASGGAPVLFVAIASLCLPPSP